MLEWRLWFSHSLIVFNILLASYFVAGNGIYTLLMMLSLVSGWLNNRRLAYENLEYFRKSAVTPPVTLSLIHI